MCQACISMCMRVSVFVCGSVCCKLFITVLSAFTVRCQADYIAQPGTRKGQAGAQRANDDTQPTLMHTHTHIPIDNGLFVCVCLLAILLLFAMRAIYQLAV